MKGWPSEVLAERSVPAPLQRRAFGLELEFEVFSDFEKIGAGALFGSPHALVNERTVIQGPHRSCVSSTSMIATSFDGGVVECATPVAFSTFKSAKYVADAIDHATSELFAAAQEWGDRHKRSITLKPYSTHISFSDPAWIASQVYITSRAYFLAHLLPLVVICTANSVDSTTVGVRPRSGGRIEIAFGQPTDQRRIWVTWTAICALIFGLTKAGAHDLESARRLGCEVPVNIGVAPSRTRVGWAFRKELMTPDPFSIPPSAKVWQLPSGRILSTSEIVLEWLERFGANEAEAAGLVAFENLLSALRMATKRDSKSCCIAVAPDALEWEFNTTPRDDVYFDATIDFLRGTHTKIDNETWRPESMSGWTQFVISSLHTGAKRHLTLDEWIFLRTTPHAKV